MGGSPKPPTQTDDQRKAEKLQTELMEQQLKQAKLDELKGPPKIEPLKPTPPPPPPPTGGSQDTEDARAEERRKASGRLNTARGTLFAGETGGYKSALGGQKTLLG